MKINHTYSLPLTLWHQSKSRFGIFVSLLTLTITAIIILTITSEPALAKGKRVTVMDRGLNMPRETYLLPSGWKLDYDIATDPNTGQYTRYKFDKLGPDGQLTRSLPPVFYGPFYGISIEQAWRKTAQQALHGMLQETRFGEPANHGPLISKIRNNKMFRQSMQKMGVEELYEVDINGKRKNKIYEGKVFAAVIPFDSQSGALLMGILISPRGLLMSTIDTDIKISQSVKANPKFTKVTQKISKRVMQQMQSSHQQRMSNNQKQFNAHQQIMNNRYQGNYKQNQQWMNNFRNSGSGNSGNNGYSSHDAYIDNIHERSTFKDPSTGENVSRDGQYDYNYTDGQGNYYGTDNPDTMQGDWQETQPLRPGY